MDTKSKEIKLKAVVIDERDYNEYDKLITLISDKLGKLKVYFVLASIHLKKIKMDILFMKQI